MQHVALFLALILVVMVLYGYYAEHTESYAQGDLVRPGVPFNDPFATCDKKYLTATCQYIDDVGMISNQECTQRCLMTNNSLKCYKSCALATSGQCNNMCTDAINSQGNNVKRCKCPSDSSTKATPYPCPIMDVQAMPLNTHIDPNTKKVTRTWRGRGSNDYCAWLKTFNPPATDTQCGDKESTCEPLPLTCTDDRFCIQCLGEDCYNTPTPQPNGN